MTVCFQRSAVAAVLAFALVGSPIDAAVPSASTSGSTPAIEAAVADAYPQLLPLTFEIEGAADRALSSLKGLTITATREGDDAPTTVLAPADPFTADNACARPLPAGISLCAVSANGRTGTLRVNYQLPASGTYRFVVTATNTNTDHRDTLVVFDLQAGGVVALVR
jgi:hypothetical protein